MKEKLLKSYENMHRHIKENGWDVKSKVLMQDKCFQYKDHKFNLRAGAVVTDCPAEEFAKIVYMNGEITKAWLHGIIKDEEIERIIEKVYGEE